MPVARLFIAIDTPPALAAQLLASLPAERGIRPTAPGQLHLTLRFLGERDEAAAVAIAAALTTVVPRPLTLAVQGTGRFRGRQGAILWAGLRADPALAQLHADVQAALTDIGIAAETRPFRAHLTLARCGAAVPEAVLCAWLARTRGLSAPPWQADRLVLYESQLAPTGARHVVRTAYPLPTAVPGPAST